MSLHFQSDYSPNKTTLLDSKRLRDLNSIVNLVVEGLPHTELISPCGVTVNVQNDYNCLEM